MIVGESPRRPPPLPEPDPPSQADEPPPDAETQSESGDSPGDAAPPEAASLTAKGLVDLVEMANVFTVQLVARQAHVPGDHPELAARMTFDKSTRTTLEALAPAAIPYVDRWLQDHALIGAIAFGGMSAISIASNMSAVRRLAPPKKRDERTVESDAQPTHAQTTIPGMEGPPPGFAR